MSQTRKLTHEQLLRMMVSAAIVLACLALAAMCSPMLYLTNDDTSIQGALSGNNTGSPYPVHRFIGVLASFFVAGLYSLAPSIQWWYVYSIALVLMGMFLVHYAILTTLSVRKHGMAMGIALSLAIDACIMMFPIARLSFTVVPVILCAGIIAWYVASPHRESPTVRITCVCLYVMAISHRDASAMVSLAFLALGALYLSYKKYGIAKALITSLLPFAIVLAAVTLLLSNGNKAFQNAWNGPEFQAFNHARVRYKDYPHDSYQENPKIYQDVEWDETLYYLVDSWCFMDERVNTESLTYLSQNSTAQSSPTSRPSPMEALNGILDSATQAKVCLVAWGVVSVYAFVTLLASRRALGAVVTLASVGAGTALLVFQYLQGRVLYRSMLVVILPSLMLNLMLALHALQDVSHPDKSTGKHPTLQGVFFVVMLLCLLPVGAKAVSNTFDAEERAHLDEVSRVGRELNEYVIAHQPTVYVQTVAVSDSIDPRLIYPESKPSNSFLWGGSQFGSKYFQAKLERNGLTSLAGTVFRENGALFVTNVSVNERNGELDEDNLLYQTIKWQAERYGALGVVQEDTICDGAYVYRFIYEEEPNTPYYAYDNGQLDLVHASDSSLS